MGGFEGKPEIEAWGNNPRYDTYATHDGKAVGVCLLETRTWKLFCDPPDAEEPPMPNDQSPLTAAPLALELGDYIAAAQRRNYPEHVVDLARMCLVDWFGVAVGAHDEPAQQAVRRVAASWCSEGVAPILLGGQAAAPVAALVNGTMAHCLDYDDLHFPSLSHLSAPIWAAVLALGAQTQASERDMLVSFITGFELGARLGSNGVGEAVSHRGWHSTGVVGRLGAAAACAVVLGLDAEKARHAVAIAATQTSGLTASFGTMSKPFHAGKAAMDGVVSAQLAAEGFLGATDILDAERSLSSALVQDGTASMQLDGLGEHWEIERNAIKPYACCGLTHATIDCGREIASELSGATVTSARLLVNPLTLQVADTRGARTPLEGKFSVTYCAALALSGHRATEADFSRERIADPALQALAARTLPIADGSLLPSAARMEVELDNGQTRLADVGVSLGNPENPMSWADMARKFTPLVKPRLGAQTEQLFDLLRGFENSGSHLRAMALVS